MDQDRLQQKIETSFRKQNFLTLLGAKLEVVEHGRVAVSCRRREDLTQQQGFLHGGVVATLADVTCGYTALTVMPEDCEVLTVEMKINLLRPALAERIVAEGSVVKAGKNLVVTEAEVRSVDTGKLIAKMLATMIPVAVEKRKEKAR